jgi:hypothetical protein
MKILGKYFFRFFDKVVVLLLSFVGILTGCEKYLDEYGMPHADYNGSPGLEYKLKFEDINMRQNSNMLINKEIEGEFTLIDRIKEGNDHWYYGLFVKTADVALEWAEANAPEYGVLADSYKS